MENSAECAYPITEDVSVGILFIGANVIGKYELNFSINDFIIFILIISNLFIYRFNLCRNTFYIHNASTN